MNTDTEQAQLFPLVVLLYWDFFFLTQIALLINAKNFFWQFLKTRIVETGHMQSHVLLLLSSTEQDMHIQGHICTYCVYAQKRAI